MSTKGLKAVTEKNTAESEKDNKPKKPHSDINIGLVVFLFVLIYLGIVIYTFLTKTEVSLFEVRPGTLFSDKKYTGIIIRSEEIVNTEKAGYVNYYFREGDRISKNETLYSIDLDRSIYDRLTEDGTEVLLENDDLSELKGIINRRYREAYSYSDYKDIKEDLCIAYTKQLDKRLLKNLNEAVKESGVKESFEVVKSVKAGILSMTFDDLSDLNIDSINKDLFEKSGEVKKVSSSDLIEKNSPVYKIITKDEWKIVVLIDEDLFVKLRENETVPFTINKKQTIVAPIETFTKGNEYYAVLSLSKYITNYTTQRYVDISFSTPYSEGLKIPYSAITNRNYYRIPEEYFAYSEDGSECYLYVEYFDAKEGKTDYNKVLTDVFYDDNIYKYIDTDYFKGETVIKCGENRNMLYTYTVMVEGCYNINNGYADFRRIERLKSGEDYVLVKTNSVSGLSEYDHIALDAAKVKQGEVIY